MGSPMRKLNPLLRLAALSGVEVAIKLHIRRGDDLDARDGSGATPLILAAGRRRKGAIRLLVEAGADPRLVDVSGMDALAHAVKSGCLETIAVLNNAMARFAALEPPVALVDEVADPSVGEVESERDAESEAPSTPIEESISVRSDRSSALVPKVELGSEPEELAPGCEPLKDLFAEDWEAEQEVSAPEGDETVAEAARQVHKAIRCHKVVDRDEDWEDVDLQLPVRAAPLIRDEGVGAVRSLLFAALREGMVSEERLVEVCSNADGSRNQEAERLLAFVAGELGATVVEWVGSDESFLSAPSMEEDRLLAEADEFAEELSSGCNDPGKFYAKDIRGDLLGAEEEVGLGREMEEAGRVALSALAAWPAGMSFVLDAAARVAAGEAEAESFSAGPEPSSEEAPASRSLGTADDEDKESELDEDALFFVNAVAVVEAAQGDARRSIEALEEVRLTRGFLMELAGKAGADQAGRDFIDALERQTKARERMILCNLRLALSVAKKYLWSGIPFDDLVQEANIGLMKAVERYDWRRGFRFSTYATWWIRQQVSRSVADTARVVRAPVHAQDAARKVLREREAVEASLGRLETESETARRIGLPLAKTRMLLAMFEDVASLDEVDLDSGLLRTEGPLDTMKSDPADVAERASLRRTLLAMLEELDERSREVILLRFGLMGADAMTLEEVGQHFGVTRERVRQIESKTMRKLSHRNKREILWYFLGDGFAPDRVPSPDLSKAEAASSADDEVSLENETRDHPEPPVEREAPRLPPLRPKCEASRVDKSIFMREEERALSDDEVSCEQDTEHRELPTRLGHRASSSTIGEPTGSS